MCHIANYLLKINTAQMMAWLFDFGLRVVPFRDVTLRLIATRWRGAGDAIDGVIANRPVTTLVCNPPSKYDMFRHRDQLFCLDCARCISLLVVVIAVIFLTANSLLRERLMTSSAYLTEHKPISAYYVVQFPRFFWKTLRFSL